MVGSIMTTQPVQMNSIEKILMLLIRIETLLLTVIKFNF